jgi:hypothetical protein
VGSTTFHAHTDRRRHGLDLWKAWVT